MIGASKILTVSYGTFSCTLEGFDEPFNTMKAIAEYFRDLAAEDRYFGAEPPTPDAAMLHKIAEREIQRRVEAKINENGVILRAGDSAAPLREIAAPAPVPPPSVEPARPVAAEAPRAPVAEPVVVAPAAPVLSDSVAAKLMRIRAAVAQARDVTDAETVAPAAALAVTEYVEDETAPLIPVAQTTAPVFAAEPPSAPVLEPEPEAEVAAAIHTLAEDAALAPRAGDVSPEPAAEAIAAEDRAETPLADVMAETLADTVAGQDDAPSLLEDEVLVEPVADAPDAPAFAEEPSAATADAVESTPDHVAEIFASAALAFAAEPEVTADSDAAAESTPDFADTAEAVVADEAMAPHLVEAEAETAIAESAADHAEVEVVAVEPALETETSFAAEADALPEPDYISDAEATLAAEPEAVPAPDYVTDITFVEPAPQQVAEAEPFLAAPVEEDASAPTAADFAADDDAALIAGLLADDALLPAADTLSAAQVAEDALPAITIAGEEDSSLQADIAEAMAVPGEAPEGLADDVAVDMNGDRDEVSPPAGDAAEPDLTATFDIPDEDLLLGEGNPGRAQDDAALQATLDALIGPDHGGAHNPLSDDDQPEASSHIADDDNAPVPVDSGAAARSAVIEAALVEAALAEAAQAKAGHAPRNALPETPAPTGEAAAVPAAEKPVLSEKAQRARARVIRIRRADPAPAATAPAPVAAPSTAAPAATLSAEAEADLMRELAEVERDAPPAAPARHDTEARKQVAAATGAESVNRLIEQTNSEMHEPENRRRLSALAHLKAAVAATVADRLSGGTPAPSEAARISPYRSDLARVVRPSRPGETGDRPAPLVLVSEQRIDRPKAAQVAYTPAFDSTAFQQPTSPAAPPQPAAAGNGFVRPRRVSSGSLAVQQAPAVEEDDDEDEDGENLFGDAKGFAEFAEKLGAHGLPDLMEAAAAYTACVEGRPHFSRPQLMRHVAAIAPEGDYSREAGLRSFGTLMRTGKIEKVKRGQFALTDSSHVLHEARKLAR